MSLTDSLKTALSELAAIRESSVMLNRTMHDAKAKFQEEHAWLINAINDTADRLRIAEAQVRTLALAAHDIDGTKKPAPGCDVVIRTTYTYDDADAMAWAEAALPTAITRTLDRKALDKIASTGALPFAQKVETPSVRLATDLSSYLPAPALTDEPPF